MNHSIYSHRFIGLLCAFSFSFWGMAQTINCASEDITFNTVITDSECQSDGMITITRGGADESNYYNYFYHLESTTGGFSTPPAIGETISMIPPGIYNLIITATCKDDSDTKYRHTIRNLKVDGNYKVIKAFYDQDKSRPSFSRCNTGTIVLNVSAGLGNNYKFKIIEAPESEGLTEPVEIVPTRIPNTNFYVFPRQDYPPGKYLVQVSDKCYTATVNLEIPVADVPFIKYPASGSRLYPNTKLPGCQYMSYSMHVDHSFYNGKPNYEAIADAELFEYSLVKTGDTPTDWRNVTKNPKLETFDMSPHSVADFYAPQSLELYVRMKACPEIKEVHKISINRFHMTDNSGNDCTQYRYRLATWTDYDGNYCFPLTIRYYKGINNTGELLRTDQVNDYSFSNPYINLDYNTDYYAEARDNHGHVVGKTVRRNKVATYNISDKECGGYFITPYITDVNFSACGNSTTVHYTYKIFDLTGLADTEQGTLVCEGNNGSGCLLKYGRKYKIQIFPTSEPGKTYETFVTRTLPPIKYSLGISSVSYCKVDHAALYVSCSVSMKPGTRVEFRGPNGFFDEQVVTGLSSNIYAKKGAQTYLPPGEYTATIIDVCGETFNVNLQHKGVFNYHDFGYTQVADCSSMRVQPKGVITYSGVDNNAGTLFKIISGPKGGYPPRYFRQGEEILLTQDGIYTLGLFATTGSCSMAEKIIDFKRPQIQLARKYTAAYACVAGTTIGQIYVKGERGEEPYTYELWNEDNTVKIPRPDGVDPDHWPLILSPYKVAFFEYGSAGESYTVRIGDKCKNNFSQKLTIGDLTSMTIAGTPNDVVCVGDEIQLTCLPLEVYSWTGPAGFTSSEQNPVIPFATRNMSGRYKVVVNPPKCGREYEGYVNIQVVPCYAPVNPALMNKGNQK